MLRGNRLTLKKRDGVTLDLRLRRSQPADLQECPDVGDRQRRAIPCSPATTIAASRPTPGSARRRARDHQRLRWVRPADHRPDEMDGVSRRLSSDYDRDGHRGHLWDNGVSYSGKYGYDGLGRMSYYLEGFGPTAFQIFYDGAGRRSRLELGVGGILSTMDYGYDGLGRLSALNRDLAGTGADQGLAFAWNAASQIRTRSSSNDSYAWAGHYAVDRSYTANGLNQYGAAGGATFDYDLNGNLKTVGNVPGGATTYVYDAENRLVSASGAKTATLSYDPLGRLWQVPRPDRHDPVPLRRRRPHPGI